MCRTVRLVKEMSLYYFGELVGELPSELTLNLRHCSLTQQTKDDNQHLHPRVARNKGDPQPTGRQTLRGKRTRRESNAGPRNVQPRVHGSGRSPRVRNLGEAGGSRLRALSEPPTEPNQGGDLQNL